MPSCSRTIVLKADLEMASPLIIFNSLWDRTADCHRITFVVIISVIYSLKVIWSLAFVCLLKCEIVLSEML